MKKIKRRLSLKKVIIISLCSIVGAFLLLSLSAYLYIYRYVDRMNYVPLEEKLTDYDSMSPERQVSYASSIIEYSSKYDYVDTEQDVKSISSYMPPQARLNEELQKNLDDERPPYSLYSSVQNLLLIGTDNRASMETGLSESVLLVSINHSKKRVALTTIHRDIYIHIPGREGGNRLNDAYTIGGTKLLIETVEENFKLNISKYIMVDLYSFIDVVNSIEGIGPIINKEEVGKVAEESNAPERIYLKLTELSMFEQINLLEVLLPQITTDFTEWEFLKQLMAITNYLEYDLVSMCIPIGEEYEEVDIGGTKVVGVDFNNIIMELNKRIYLTSWEE